VRSSNSPVTVISIPSPSVTIIHTNFDTAYTAHSGGPCVRITRLPAIQRHIIRGPTQHAVIDGCIIETVQCHPSKILS
jgi:hypothetical protein